MANNHRIFSVQLPASVVDQIDAEAQALNISRSDYGRALIEGRHQKPISVTPQAQQLIEHYTQQIDQHQQDCQDQQQHLSQDHQRQVDQLQHQLDQLKSQLAQTRQSLNQQQQVQDQLQDEYNQLYVRSHIDGLTLQEKAEQLAATRQQVQEWQTKYEHFKGELAQLKRQRAKDKMNWLGALGEGVGQILETNPAIGLTIAQEGLQGLLRGKSSTPAASPPSAETKLGQAIRADFPGQSIYIILDVLQYLRDTPQAKAQLLAKPEFVAYQAKLRAAKAKAS